MRSREAPWLRRQNDMWGLIKAGLVALGQLLGVIQKAQDASHDAVERQAGADAQAKASLDAIVKVARDQTAAIVNAPDTPSETAADMRKGGF